MKSSPIIVTLFSIMQVKLFYLRTYQTNFQRPSKVLNLCTALYRHSRNLNVTHDKLISGLSNRLKGNISTLADNNTLIF